MGMMITSDKAHVFLVLGVIDYGYAGEESLRSWEFKVNVVAWDAAGAREAAIRYAAGFFDREYRSKVDVSHTPRILLCTRLVEVEGIAESVVKGRV